MKTLVFLRKIKIKRKKTVIVCGIRSQKKRAILLREKKIFETKWSKNPKKM